MNQDPLGEQKTKYEKEAIQSTIKFLMGEPETLSDFLDDLKSNRHRKWQVYRAYFSQAKTKDVKGRAQPARKSGGISIHRTEQLAKEYARAGQTHTPILHLGYLHRPEDKIRKISGSDATPQIKAELLAVVLLEIAKAEQIKGVDL